MGLPVALRGRAGPVQRWDFVLLAPGTAAAAAGLGDGTVGGPALSLPEQSGEGPAAEASLQAIIFV